MSNFRYSFADIETDPLRILRLAQIGSSLDWELDLFNTRSVRGSDRTKGAIKVRYGDDELEGFCRETVDSLSPPYNPPQSPAMTQIRATVIGASKLGLVKDDAFRDEKEWRIVVTEPVRSPLMRFRPGGRLGFIPYIELKFPKSAISTVMVGPGGDEKMREHSLRQFLVDSGYENVKVDISGVPYRA